MVLSKFFIMSLRRIIGFLLAIYLTGFFTWLESKEDQNEDFSDILLIINYNTPFYQTMDFLKEIYSPVFPNIVFYGEDFHPEVHVIAHHRGWWGHEVLRDAMIRYPNYRGYLCLQDDCFLNFWNLTRLDKNKVWFNRSYYHPVEYLINIDEVNNFWGWWNLPSGREAMLNVFLTLPERYLEKAAEQLGVGNVSIRLCDCIYLPVRLRQDYIDACAYFSNPPVFVEIAQPFILFCIEGEDNWEFLNMHWVWPHDRAITEYSPEYDWVHPFKFSSIANQEFIRRIIKEHYLTQ
jgi:hypothetical protein